jgi:hypothetical protein
VEDNFHRGLGYNTFALLWTHGGRTSMQSSSSTETTHDMRMWSSLYVTSSTSYTFYLFDALIYFVLVVGISPTLPIQKNIYCYSNSNLFRFGLVASTISSCFLVSKACENHQVRIQTIRRPLQSRLMQHTWSRRTCQVIPHPACCNKGPSDPSDYSTQSCSQDVIDA